MSKSRIAILALTFFIGMIFQPMWVTENFWTKANFWDSIPVEVPYFAFLFVYAVITTLTMEFSIRFIKKYA